MPMLDGFKVTKGQLNRHYVIEFTDCMTCTHSLVISNTINETCHECIDGDEYVKRESSQPLKRIPTNNNTHCKGCTYSSKYNEIPLETCYSCYDGAKYTRAISEPNTTIGTVHQPTKRSIDSYQYNPKSKESTIMTTTDKLNTLLTINKESLKDTAQLKTAEILLANATKIVQRYTPEKYKDLLEFPGAELAVANIATLFLLIFGPDTKRTEEAIRSLVISGQLSLLKDFDPALIYKELMDGITDPVSQPKEGE